MGNGFRAHLLLKKVLFAFLSDPQYGPALRRFVRDYLQREDS